MTWLWHKFFSVWTARRYIALTCILCAFLAGCFIGLNFAANDFGLWKHRDTARIWGLEKSSKYLLAHRYIPENFEGIMIGSSVAANIDTRLIKGAKIYNLSMVGGNITEGSAAARLYIERAKNPRVLIISLYPYLTKNHGIKGFEIHDKEYYGSLYSLLPPAIWAYKAKTWLRPATDELRDSAAGWNQFELTQARQDLTAWRSSQKTNPAPVDPIVIDPVAVRELEDLINLARKRDMMIIGYFHPNYMPLHKQLREDGGWTEYRRAMKRLFLRSETVVDMNGPLYNSLRRDEAMRIDLSHLSSAGAREVGLELDKIVAEALKKAPLR